MKCRKLLGEATDIRKKRELRAKKFALRERKEPLVVGYVIRWG